MDDIAESDDPDRPCPACGEVGGLIDYGLIPSDAPGLPDGCHHYECEKCGCGHPHKPGGTDE